MIAQLIVSWEIKTAANGADGTPSWLSALFWDCSWFRVWTEKKGKLVKKEIKV